ncbi:MAG: flagellar protein FlaG [Nitrospirae bacterium]|nr:flagellar protein FlaG [Candidatus Manganitrophaceae bacterium]
MNDISTIPQTTAVALTSSSTKSSDGNSKKLPVGGQNMPPETQEKETTVQMTNEAIQKTVKQLNEFSRSQGRNLQFSVDKVSDLTVITVVNKETNEVIRQIPSEEVVRLARQIEFETSTILDVQA